LFELGIEHCQRPEAAEDHLIGRPESAEHTDELGQRVQGLGLLKGASQLLHASTSGQIIEKRLQQPGL